MPLAAGTGDGIVPVMIRAGDLAHGQEEYAMRKIAGCSAIADPLKNIEQQALSAILKHCENYPILKDI